MSYRHKLSHILRRVSPSLRERGRVIRKFSDQLGMVYFGVVDQHDDDHSAIRGFSASLTHKDAHYAVGTYEGHDIRLVDRLDLISVPGKGNHQQVWTIVEIDLNAKDLPHVFFVPTGKPGAEYSRLFAAQPYLQPLNTYIASAHVSSEFHGRYQLLARTTHVPQVEHLFQPHIVADIGTRFWPHGIEIQHSKLYVYLTEPKLNKATLQTAVSSAMLLASHINEVAETL